MDEKTINYRLGQLDKGQTRIIKILEGNGSGGVVTRLTKVEDRAAVQESRWKWLFGIMGGIIVSVTAAIIIISLKG